MPGDWRVFSTERKGEKFWKKLTLMWYEFFGFSSFGENFFTATNIDWTTIVRFHLEYSYGDAYSCEVESLFKYVSDRHQMQ